MFVRRIDSSLQIFSLYTFLELLVPERSYSNISFFDVDEYQLEIMENSHWSVVQNSLLEPDVFFVDGYTKKQWTDSIKALSLPRKLVYLVTPTKLQLMFWEEDKLSEPADVTIKGYISEGQRT